MLPALCLRTHKIKLNKVKHENFLKVQLDQRDKESGPCQSTYSVIDNVLQGHV